MILKYIWKNFTRRKIRTILMMLSLIISTGLIVAMSAMVETMKRSNVDIISSGIGRHDLAILKTDISPNPFIDIEHATNLIDSAETPVTAIHPRFRTQVELADKGTFTTNWLIALDPDHDDIGTVNVITGTYKLGDGNAAVLETTANANNLNIGDSINIAYSFPQPREKGFIAPAGSSSRRTAKQFTVTAIVRQDGVTDSDIRNGLIISLQDAQEWLGLPGSAERLLMVVDPSLYEARNSETAALNVRDVASALQARLGDGYEYELQKAQALDQSAEGFLILQALINTYGFMALGVVGLLVHTLVMTNVQEQRRDMAVLRILGAQKNFLYVLVLSEVFIIGLVGISLGVVLGRAINQYAILPFINAQISNIGLTSNLQPVVSLSAILPAIISAILVLIFSTLKPARDASNTKVMHAINPGVADNIQIEDLAKLRERKGNGRLFFAGLILMFSVLMSMGLDIISTLGNPALEATIVLTAILMMVVGISLMFFITTVPFERLILFIMSAIAPRLTFFARRNVSRNQARNTLISLLVLFSGVLPSFLATQMAIQNANLDTDVRLRSGAPLTINTFGGFGSFVQTGLPPSFLSEELSQISGIDKVIGITSGYNASVSDPVDMRSGSLNLVGVDGDLSDVLYQELIAFSGGNIDALSTILDDPSTIVISQSLSDALAIPLGGIVRLTGEGLDHEVEFRVIGIASRLPGINGIGNFRSTGQFGSTALVSLEAFRHLSSDPKGNVIAENEAIISKILGTISEGSDPEEVSLEMGQRFSLEYNIYTQLTEVRLQQAKDSRVQQQAFLLVLTIISFTTAVFGVFAVIYVTIYARRLEMGMMKAFGTLSRELTGMLIVESIAMTLSAALAGIAAGATMAYIFALADNVTAQRPFKFALDTTVMPFIVIMVVLASILGAVFSSRRIVKHKAVEILRM